MMWVAGGAGGGGVGVGETVGTLFVNGLGLLFFSLQLFNNSKNLKIHFLGCYMWDGLNGLPDLLDHLEKGFVFRLTWNCLLLNG